MLFETNPADEKIFLLQNETVISDDTKQIYNDYFCNITDTVDISSWNTSLILQEDLDHNENILANFCNHPSISKTKTSRTATTGNGNIRKYNLY